MGKNVVCILSWTFILKYHQIISLISIIFNKHVFVTGNIDTKPMEKLITNPIDLALTTLPQRISYPTSNANPNPLPCSAFLLCVTL